MKVAVIDIGTNNFNLLVAQQDEFFYKTLLKSKSFVFLGKGGIQEKRILPEAIERALEALQTFKKQIEAHGEMPILAIATSAVRNAQNGDEFVRLVKEQIGIEIQVIDGEREASLIFYGIKRHIRLPDNVLVMDIGGGSVEFIIGNSEQLYWKESFEIGAQRLFYLFHKTEPISPQALNEMNEFLSQKLTNLFTALQKYPTDILVGSAGSFDTIVDIFCTEQGLPNTLRTNRYFQLPVHFFYQVHQQLIHKHLEQRKAMTGMLEQRAEMMTVAASLIDFVLKNCAMQQIIVSAAALKEGVVANYFDQNNLL